MSLQPTVRLVQATNLPKQRRKPRKPQHFFNIRSRPFEITPFMIAPVLPGETLTNLLHQCSVVSDPIANRLIGWHKEYYYFYISHRALAHPELGMFDMGDITGMMLNPDINLNDYLAANDVVQKYTFGGGVMWVEALLSYVTKRWFRDEDEMSATPSLELYPTAQISQRNWAHSLKAASTGQDDPELPGVDPQEETDILPGFTTEYDQWEMMRDAGMTDLSYADYLKSYGITGQPTDVSDSLSGTTPEVYPAELIRFFRKFTHPISAIDPADGSAASAVTWKIAERADKRRLFKEPGFIFGVTTTRPKIYLGSQKGSAVGMLNNAYGWLPAVLRGLPYTSLEATTNSTTAGILENQTEPYWLDVADLFRYGDQFVNYAMSAAENHGIAVPSATMDKKYPTLAMVKSLFVDAAGTANYIREDGVVHLDILADPSVSVDTTPGQ